MDRERNKIIIFIKLKYLIISMNIEVELRTFLTKEKYAELLEFFNRNGSFMSTEKQETHYLNTSEDLRIQKNDFFAKIWMKKGKLHDEAREEIEVHFQKEDFAKIENICTTIGLTPKIKWYRTRITFAWEGISVMIDDTKGYGYILELEKMSKEEIRDSKKKSQKQVLEELYQWVQTCKEQTFAGENPFFDRDFIATSVKRENITWIVPYRTIDLHTVAYTYHLKKGLLPPLKEKRTAINLDYILTLVGLPEEPKPHNALTGAKMEAEAFSRLLQKKILLKEFEKYPIPEHLED